MKYKKYHSVGTVPITIPSTNSRNRQNRYP